MGAETIASGTDSGNRRGEDKEGSELGLDVQA